MFRGGAAEEVTVVGWELLDRREEPGSRVEQVRLGVVTARPGEGAENPPIVARYHPATGDGRRAAVGGVVWVGGVGGGVTGPADGMYPRLASALADEGVASLRVDYRVPYELEPCVVDCVIGVGFLREEGVKPVALVGHSSGGAVVIATGAMLEGIATVVALATQTFGTDLARELAPASLLLVHGTEDDVLPVSCSVDVKRRARTRTELRIIDGAGHSFEGREREVNALVLDWLRRELAPARQAAADA